MAGRLVSAVFESALPAWLKPYAATYASFAAPDGSRVFPSVARVARMVGRSERATQTALHELRRRGVLVLVCAHAPGRTAQYQFHGSALPQMTDPGQLSLFQQANVNKPQGNPEITEVFHSHPQAYTRSPLRVMGEAHFTRSVSDPSVVTSTRRDARKTGTR
jgi:hypothetical protein